MLSDNSVPVASPFCFVSLFAATIDRYGVWPLVALRSLMGLILHVSRLSQALNCAVYQCHISCVLPRRTTVVDGELTSSRWSCDLCAAVFHRSRLMFCFCILRPAAVRLCAHVCANVRHIANITRRTLLRHALATHVLSVARLSCHHSLPLSSLPCLRAHASLSNGPVYAKAGRAAMTCHALPLGSSDEL